MKKLTYLAVAAIAALSSCSSDDIATGNNRTSGSVGVTEFTATIDNGNGITSRTAYDATNRYATWIANTDQISVNGYTYRAKDTGSTTAFTPTGDEAAAADTYTAYYPATMYNSGTISMPASYNYSTNSPYNMPMYAESTTTALSFKNLTGVIALTVPSNVLATVNSITVTSDQHLSGQCTINYNSGAPTITWTNATATDAEKQVKINCGPGVAATTFYIPVPAGSHSSLTFTVSDGSDTKIMKAKTAITIARNTLYMLTFKQNCIATKGTAKATINGTVYYIPWVQLWADGPKFAIYNYDSTPSNMSETNVGTTKTFSTTFTEWGGNWTIGTYDTNGTGAYNMYNLWNGMDTYGNPAYGTYVKCEYTSQNGVYGFLVTGTTTDYTNNSIFLPAKNGDSEVGYANYWSGTDDSGSGCNLGLGYYYDSWTSDWYTDNTSNNLLVRPVLK